MSSNPLQNELLNSMFWLLIIVLKKFKNLDSTLVKLVTPPANTENSVVYFSGALQEVFDFCNRALKLYDILKRAAGSFHEESSKKIISEMICGVQIEKLESIKRFLKDYFEVERSREANQQSRHLEALQAEAIEEQDEFREQDQAKQPLGHKEKCFYFLKEKRSIIVDLARLSFARIDESLSEATLGYKQKISPAIKLVRNRKAGFCLKIPVSASFLKEIDNCLNETITFKEDFEKFTLIQTETLKRFTITRNQSEQEILCETFQYVFSEKVHK